MVDNPQQSLKKKSISAVIWSGADLFMRQGFQFIVAIILARLLSPDEFGTIALLYLFTGIASTFVDSGFSAALIQKNDATLTDESTVFWFNLFMGAVMTAGLWFIAPWVSEFYNSPELIVLTRFLAFTVVINALGSVHNTLFVKALNFKPGMKIGVISSLSSGLLAIYLAREGFGVWALAVQALLTSIVTTILLWFFSPWRPRWKFSLKSVQSLFGFGSYLMAAGLIDIIYKQLYTVLIGKIYGVSQLGFYDRANNTKQIPIKLLSGILARVAFPIFSAAKKDKEKLYKGVQLAVQSLMLINTPIMFGILVTADNLVLVLFGEKWLESVPLLQILCLAGIFWPLHVINLNVLKAQGYSGLFFKLEVFKKVFGTLFLLVGIFYYGVPGLAWSQVAFSFIAFFINAFYTGKKINYGAWKQIWDFISILFISFAMAVAVYFTRYYIIDSALVILINQMIIGICLYTLLCVLLQVKAYKTVIKLFSRR